MKLSDQLARDHESGDFGNALRGYSDRATELEQQLSKLEKQNVLLRGYLEQLACLGNGDRHGNSIGNGIAIKALDATADLAGLVVCDAVPMAHYVYIADQQTGYVVEDLDDAIDDLTNTNATTQPLFAKKEQS
jgi:hypothetical protein